MDSFESLIKYLIDKVERGGSTSEVQFGDDGNPIGFKDSISGVVHPGLPASERAAKQAGLTSRSTFGSDLGSPRVQSGTYHRRMLEEFQEKLGSEYQVDLETWKITNGNVDDFLDKLKAGSKILGGFVVPDPDSTKVIKVRKDGKILSHEQIAKLLNRELGIFANIGDKVPKRLGGLLNPVPYAIETQEAMTAFVFEEGNITSRALQRQFGDMSEQTAKHAFDGAVWLNPKYVGVYVNQMKERATKMVSSYISLSSSLGLDDLESELVNLKPQTLEDSTKVQNAIDHIRQARKLEQSAKTGHGIFNIRAYGLNVAGATDTYSTAEGVMAKGNVLWLDPKIASEMENEIGGPIHIVGSASNFKTEAGIASGRGSFMTLDPRKGSLGKPVYLDIDTMLTHHDFYDPQQLIRKNKDLFEQYTETLKLGDVPESLRRSLEQYTPDVLPEDLVANLGMQEKRAWFANFAMMNQYGIPITENPLMMQQLLSQYEKQMTKGGLPRMVLPDTIRGEVMSESMFKLKRGITPQRMRNIKPGAIDTFDDDLTVIADADARKFYHAFGGFDLDDALIQMLRWDKKQERLKAIVFRQPTGIGEQAVFDVANDAEIIDTILKNRNDELAKTTLARRQAIREQIRETERVVDEKKATRLANRITQANKRLEADVDRAMNFAERGKDYVSGMDHQAVIAKRNADQSELTKIKDARSQLRRLRKEMSQDFANIFEHHENTDEILLRSIAFENLTKAQQQRVLSNTGAEVGGIHSLFKEDSVFIDSIKKEQESTAARLARSSYDSNYVESQLRLMAETQGQLGSYSNARMFAANVVGDHLDAIKDLDFGENVIRYIKQESAIDATINLQQLAEGNTLANMTQQLYQDVGRVAAHARNQGVDITFDSVLMGVKGKATARSNLLLGIQAANQELDTEYKFTEFLDTEDRGMYARMSQMWTDTIDSVKEHASFMVGESQFSKSISDIAFEQEDVDEADKFLNFASERLRLAREAAGETELYDDDIFKTFDGSERSAALFDDAHRDILDYVGTWAEETPDADAFFQRFGAAIQGVQSKSRTMQNIFNKGFFDITQTASGEIGRKTGVDLAYLTQATQAYFGTQAHETGRLPLEPERYVKQQYLVEEARMRIEAGEIAQSAARRPFAASPGAESFAARARAATESSSMINPSRLRQIDSDILKQAWDIPSVRKSGIGLLGVVAASFLYQGIKGRSVDDMEGQGYLPGGSPYEQMSSSDLNYQTSGNFSPSTNLGTNFQIQIKSGGNSQQIADGFGQLTGSNVNGTMYKRNKNNFDSSYGSVAGAY